MTGPSLRLGSAEFDEETPVAVREKSSARERMKKAAASGREFYEDRIAPHKRAIALVIAGLGVATGAALTGASFWEAHQERQAQTEQDTRARETPKASLKLSAKAKHDGNGRLSYFDVKEDFKSVEVDGCPVGTHPLSGKTESVNEVGQGIYLVTTVLHTKAHGRDLVYRFSFEVDGNDYDYMPVEAILVQ